MCFTLWPSGVTWAAGNKDGKLLPSGAAVGTPTITSVGGAVAVTTPGTNARVSKQAPGLRSATTLPKQFSMVDLPATPQVPAVQETPGTENWLPSLRNQYGWGNCWSFAAVAAAESSEVVNHVQDKATDLSARHLVSAVYSQGMFFTNHGTQTDPPASQAGGNSYQAAAAFARRYGPELRSTYPDPTYQGSPSSAAGLTALYNDTTFGRITDTSELDSYQYDLQQAQFYSNPTIDTTDDSIINPDTFEPDNLNAIKQALVSKGALTVLFCATRTSGNDGANKTDDWNPMTSAWYNAGYQTPDHAVTIVGYDDDFPAQDFGNVQPNGNGAFLIQNSWGSGTGDGNWPYGNNGYFWLSYYDPTIADTSSLTLTKKDAYGSVLQQLDNTGWIGGYISDPASMSIANVYKAPTSGGAIASINAVSFYTVMPGESAQVRLYSAPPDSDDPTSGALLASCKTLTESASGYYTLRLDAPVSIPAGHKYVVSVTYSAPSGKTYVPIETPKSGDEVSINPGETYLRTQNYGWEDLGGPSDTVSNAPIKVHMSMQSLSASALHASAAAQTYSGQPLQPAATVEYGTYPLTAGNDYAVTAYANNVNAGTATVIVTGKGVFSGLSARGSFKINPRTLAGASVSYAHSKTYNGKMAKPAVTVKLSGKTLLRNSSTSNANIKLSYATSAAVGAHYISISGRGNYCGSLPKQEFTVLPKATSVSKLSVGKRTLTVKIKEASKSYASGYRIYYKESGGSYKSVYAKSYKSTTKKLSKLKKGKHYYVKVRAYKTVRGIKYYSSYSKTKKSRKIE
jgi:C1A family cysteine protease